MNMQPLVSDIITVAGLELRTIHTRASQEIPALWGRFGSGEVFAKTAGQQLGAEVYAVYCDYESDYQGLYTLVLGLRVAESVQIAGLRTVTIPAGNYAKIAVSGHPAEVIPSAWEFVNGAWADKAKRRYGSDFERYAASSTAAHCEAEVVIGMR